MELCYCEEKEVSLAFQMSTKLATKAFFLGIENCDEKNLFARISCAVGMAIIAGVVGFVAGSAISLSVYGLSTACDKVGQVARGVFARAA